MITKFILIINLVLNIRFKILTSEILGTLKYDQDSLISYSLSSVFVRVPTRTGMNLYNTANVS